MKKTTILFYLLLLFSFDSYSQVQVGFGNNTTQYLPFSPYHQFSYSQSIYLSDEINASGAITSLQWYFSGTGNLANSQQLVIYLGTTTKSVFASSTDWEPVSNLTQVYAGGIKTGSTPGWKTITLATPFFYNGIDNLILAVDENQTDGDGFDDRFYNYPVIGQRSILYYSTSVNADPATPPAAIKTTNYIPNIIFDIDDSYLDKIKLVAFVDENSNGIQDNYENNFTYGSFVLQQNNTGTPTTVFSPNGIYKLFDANPANTYNFSYQINPEFAAYYTAGTTNYNNINIPIGSGTQTLYFPITLTQGYNDVGVSIIPQNNPVPGLTYTNLIRYRNSGIVNSSGTLTFTKPSQTTITDINQTGTISTATGFTYDFTNLAPNETRSILVKMIVPTIPTVNLGDILTSSASISAQENDINLTNNTFTLNRTIVGSYDPNDITEAHGEKITFSNFGTDEYLTYTIRFQNTGTASAERVRVEDVLDTKLDPQSIRMVSASHAYVMERVNNNIVWQFNGINLPWASQNEEASNGYITFQIKLKPGFTTGDIVPSVADIYFDFNPAITTNTFNTEFVAQLGSTTFSSENVLLYPNPANNQVNISLQNRAENLDCILIYDVLGNCVKKASNLSSNQSLINVSDLSKGVYLMEITTENQLKMTKKLVIE